MHNSPNKKTKIIILVSGGCGNQMFSYAMYRYLQQQGKDVYLDLHLYDVCYEKAAHETYRLEKYFNLTRNQIAGFDECAQIMDIEHLYTLPQLIQKNMKWYRLVPIMIQKICRKTVLKKIPGLATLKSSHFIENESNKNFYLSNIVKDVYLEGLFQVYQPANQIRSILLQDFAFTHPLPTSIQQILEDINNSHSVSIHVRRGDYFTVPVYNFLAILTLQYYKNALQYLKSRFTDLRFFLFSNDMDWVKDHFTFLDNWVIVDTSNEAISDYYDLLLMSKSKHNIIANSSFSFWAAWLNQNPQKVVVVPEVWDKYNHTPDEICPPDWVRIPVK
ncbi:MAG: O-antigen biosynthesis glycosyltransferase WbnK [Candidatus Ordinivivax streblomastigis]|uniref:O-antigen biosynthesis glycosyltransferase WbnK n=1 Tax=Candidatus Ordinivivax streblomastigis TaxID=2540710 RepID=A0A5M8P597_9BACT|nr:MAG: O-antigen biosynthesis glycosyltransferase WbnK [Candidatus Ordinivivax streblomastigis]